ncbi:MAG: hypothetical protein HYY88_09510 [candidate division NC10 bacterium]|nr:hypothetical protein [candidate division NC10 bacterium]MBI3085947.1 hypothetical protein [candidate division NC10 bacterium]
MTVVLVAWAPRASHWSPYYRIDFSPMFLEAPAEPGGAVQVGYTLDVNRDFHQRALNMSEEIDPAILDLGRRFHPEGPYRVDGVRIIFRGWRLAWMRA